MIFVKFFEITSIAELEKQERIAEEKRLAEEKKTS